MKTINEVSLYDLMAEDLEIYVTKSKDFGFTVEVTDEKGKTLLIDESIHPCAAESFAQLCRSYLSSYEKASLEAL